MGRFWVSGEGDNCVDQSVCVYECKYPVDACITVIIPRPALTLGVLLVPHPLYENLPVIVILEGVPLPFPSVADGEGNAIAELEPDLCCCALSESSEGLAGLEAQCKRGEGAGVDVEDGHGRRRGGAVCDRVKLGSVWGVYDAGIRGI